MRFSVIRRDTYVVEFEAESEEKAQRIVDGEFATDEERGEGDYLLNSGAFVGSEFEELKEE